MNKELSIGLIGFGCVGSGLYEVLNKSGLIQAKISKIVVKDRYKRRSIGQENFSFNVNDILEDDTINVVVELIDNSEEAFAIGASPFASRDTSPSSASTSAICGRGPTSWASSASRMARR